MCPVVSYLKNMGRSSQMIAIEKSACYSIVEGGLLDATGWGKWTSGSLPRAGAWESASAEIFWKGHKATFTSWEDGAHRNENIVQTLYER